ncbi:MAG: App1 family protein [Phycisphaerae bacterium]|nr:App1 family protein [Phycisphaerae bacterium]
MRDRRHWVALVWAASALALAGCQPTSEVRSGLLLQGFDTLAYPDQEVMLTARLQGGDYLKGMEGYLIGFYESNLRIGGVRTDDEGLAEIAFKPQGEGNHVILARLEDPDVRKYAVPAVEIVVAAWPREKAMAVVDLDRTVVQSGFAEVMAGRAEPMDHSQQVLHRLTRDRTVIYLTHRPDMFTEQSKQWLRKYDYPLGPLLVSTLSEFIKGSREFKNARVHALKQSFPGITLGIGDKVSDAEVYLDNQMRAVLIIHPDDMPTAEVVRIWIQRLRRLPEKVDVVDNWLQVEEVLFQEKRYPPSQAIERLSQLANQRAQEAAAAMTQNGNGGGASSGNGSGEAKP